MLAFLRLVARVFVEFKAFHRGHFFDGLRKGERRRRTKVRIRYQIRIVRRIQKVVFVFSISTTNSLLVCAFIRVLRRLLFVLRIVLSCHCLGIARRIRCVLHDYP